MAAQKWEKHTINLIYGSDLDMKFKISPNKSHMVRHVFQRANELRMEVLNLIDENQQMKENIAKLQARLSGDRTDEDVIREMKLDPSQTFFEAYAPDWIPKDSSRDVEEE
jgi:regulator of replication initiation timing